MYLPGEVMPSMSRPGSIRGVEVQGIARSIDA